MRAGLEDLKGCGHLQSIMMLVFILIDLVIGIEGHTHDWVVSMKELPVRRQLDTIALFGYDIDYATVATLAFCFLGLLCIFVGCARAAYLRFCLGDREAASRALTGGTNMARAFV